nr:MAG TPA: hypothetical protein [Caudoviricetes sp.]
MAFITSFILLTDSSEAICHTSVLEISDYIHI